MSEPSAIYDGFTALAAGNTSGTPVRVPQVLKPSDEGGRLVCARCHGLRGWELLLGRLRTQLTNP